MQLHLQVRADGGKFGGESWLWDRNGFRTVIDIGKTPAFRRGAASFSPNVVIFTHDDADHIGNVGHAARFIEDVPRLPDRWVPDGFSSGIPQQVEFWLPMDWFHLGLAALQVLSPTVSEGSEQRTPDPTTEDELDHEFTLRFFEPSAAADLLPNSCDEDIFRRRELDLDEDTYAREAAPLPAQFAALNDAPRGHIEQAVRAVVDDYRRGAPPGALPDGTKEIAKRAGASAARVGAILATLASHQHLVRFFDVDRAWLHPRPLWPNQGMRGTVTIINAVETTQPRDHVVFRKPALALLFASRLTVQNRRALATFLWPTDAESWPWTPPPRRDGVIIWSDTSGKIGGQRPTAEMVPWRHADAMSAPHHASDNSSHLALWQHRPPHVKVILSNNKERDTGEWDAVDRHLRDCAKCGQQRRTSVGAVSAWPEHGVELLAHCTEP